MKRLLLAAILSSFGLFGVGCGNLDSMRVAYGNKASASMPPRNELSDFSVPIGANIAECRRHFKSKRLRELPAASMLESYPFVEKLRFLSGFGVVIWTDDTLRSNGWPCFWLAAFSGGNFTNLVDLLEVRDGFKYPRVDGVYNRNLMSMRPGMTVNHLYEKLGVDDGYYYQASDGKWRIKFNYTGFKGQRIVIEADAATGRIVLAQERTI